MVERMADDTRAEWARLAGAVPVRIVQWDADGVRHEGEAIVTPLAADQDPEPIVLAPYCEHAVAWADAAFQRRPLALPPARADTDE
jgi:hypothetical protein